MKLAPWRTGKGLTIQQLAHGIGENYETTRRYLAGTRRPTAARMVAIYVFTDGAVTPNDFHDLPKLTPPPRAESPAGAVGVAS